MSRYFMYRYTDVKKLRKKDFYPTPIKAAKQALSRLLNDHFLHSDFDYAPTVLDAGCGYGSLGRAWRWLQSENNPIYAASLYGLELRKRKYARNLKSSIAPGGTVYQHVSFGFDYLSQDRWQRQTRLPTNYDIIVSNPPFTYWTQFWEKSWELLKPGGLLGMYAPLSYLQGEGKRPETLWEPLRTVYVYAYRIDWQRKGSPSDQTMFCVWQKDVIPVTPTIERIYRRD